MKKTLGLLAAVLVALSLSAFAQSDSAQDKSSQTQSQGMGRQHHGMGSHEAMNGDRMLDRLDQELQLTADQRAQIKTIIDKQHAQMQSQSAGSEDRDARMKQMQETHAQIRTVLKPDQQAKFDKMMKEHDRMGHHHGEMDKDQSKDDQTTSPSPR